LALELRKSRKRLILALELRKSGKRLTSLFVLVLVLGHESCWVQQACGLLTVLKLIVFLQDLGIHPGETDFGDQTVAYPEQSVNISGLLRFISRIAGKDPSGP